MNKVEHLKEIGFKQIAEKTHIEAEYLEWIVNKDFEKLSKKNVNAFIKILSREYDIDFSKWQEEYEEFFNLNSEMDKDRIFVSPKIISYKPKEKTGIFWKIAFFVLVIFVAWFFDFFRYFDFVPEILSDNSRSVKYTDSVVVEKAKQNLEKNSQILEDGNLTVENSVIINKQSGENLDDTTKEYDANDSTTSIEINNIDEKPISAENREKISIQSEDLTPKTLIIEPEKQPDSLDFFGLNSTKSVIIEPKNSLWIGMIDLKNDKRKSLIIDDSFELDINRPQLIITGHGNFELNQDGVKSYPDENRASRCRYLIQDGEIKQINRSEFIKMNKGRDW